MDVVHQDDQLGNSGSSSGPALGDQGASAGVYYQPVGGEVPVPEPVKPSQPSVSPTTTTTSPLPDASPSPGSPVVGPEPKAASPELVAAQPAPVDPSSASSSNKVETNPPSPAANSSSNVVQRMQAANSSAKESKTKYLIMGAMLLFVVIIVGGWLFMQFNSSETTSPTYLDTGSNAMPTNNAPTSSSTQTETNDMVSLPTSSEQQKQFLMMRDFYPQAEVIPVETSMGLTGELRVIEESSKTVFALRLVGLDAYQDVPFRLWISSDSGMEQGELSPVIDEFGEAVLYAIADYPGSRADVTEVHVAADAGTYGPATTEPLVKVAL